MDSSGEINASQIPSGNVTSLGANSLLSAGNAQSFARSNHVHSIVTAAPLALTPNQTLDAGTGNALARADHVHSISTDAPVTLEIGGTNIEGTSDSFARADHKHSVALVNAYVGGSTNITTTNPSFVTMPGQTYTVPANGIYWVNFTGSFAIARTTGRCTASIFVDGSEIESSRVTGASRSTSVTEFPMATQAIVSAVAGTVIDIRWSTNTGAITATNARRSFSVIRLS